LKNFKIRPTGRPPVPFPEVLAAARQAPPSEPAHQVAAAVDEIERRCHNMNAGEPGWHLRDRILAVCKGGATAGGDR
jgi:hypothetical protein